MANRYIAFGYEITNGQIAIIDAERLVVERIFAMYVNGKSLLEIAERLNASGISYNNDGRSWNKHIIKRILDNRKYLGEDGYPAIIQPELFARADKQKQTRYTPRSKEQEALNRLLHDKLICGVCGGAMKRQQYGKKSRRRRWLCKDAACEGRLDVHDEQRLCMGIVTALNVLIENTDAYCTQETGAPTPTIAQPQIIYNPNIPIEQLVADICRAAEQRYAASRTVDDTAVNRKLKQQLALYTHLEQIDLPLLQAVAQKIILYPEQRIGIRLPNGRVVKGGAQNAGCIPADGNPA